MKQQRLALVAHTDPRVRSQVEAALEKHGIATVYARNCVEVGAALSARKSPELVFTGSNFANGNWRDVLALARTAKPPVDVVLAIDEGEPCAEPDPSGLQLDRLDAAAFDFVVLPFGADIGQVLARRFAKPRAVQPWRRRQLEPRSRRSQVIPSAAAGRYSPFEVLGRAWTRASKLAR